MIFFLTNNSTVINSKPIFYSKHVFDRAKHEKEDERERRNFESSLW